MDLRALHAFRLIVETGSISAAAARLGTAQSALSARISRFEATVGEPLLERLPRGVRLTAAGRRLLPFAERLDRLAAEAVDAARNRRDALDGPFRLGAIEVVAASSLPPVLSRLIADRPGIALNLRTGVSRGLSEALAAGELDAAIVAGRTRNDADIAFRPLEPVPLALFRPTGRPLEALDQAFAFGAGCVCRSRLEALVHRRRLAMRVVELGSLEAILGCVAAGLGIALLPATLRAPAGIEREAAGSLALFLNYRMEAEARADALAASYRKG